MSLKIYRVQNDTDFGGLLPTERSMSPFLDSRISFEGERLKVDWVPLEFYPKKPQQPLGDFVNVSKGSGLLTFRQEVCDTLCGEIAENSGELFPATIEKLVTKLYMLNIIAVYNCLDLDHCECRRAGSSIAEMKKYAFHPDRIGGCNLFKVPSIVP